MIIDFEKYKKSKGNCESEEDLVYEDDLSEVDLSDVMVQCACGSINFMIFADRICCAMCHVEKDFDDKG